MEMRALQMPQNQTELLVTFKSKRWPFMISKCKNKDKFRPDIFEMNLNWNIHERINENVKQNDQFAKQGIGNFNVDILVDFFTIQMYRGA